MVFIVYTKDIVREVRLCVKVWILKHIDRSYTDDDDVHDYPDGKDDDDDSDSDDDDDDDDTEVRYNFTVHDDYEKAINDVLSMLTQKFFKTGVFKDPNAANEEQWRVIHFLDKHGEPHFIAFCHETNLPCTLPHKNFMTMHIK